MDLRRFFRRDAQNPHVIDIPQSTVQPILDLIDHIQEADIRAKIKELSEIIVRDYILNQERNLDELALCRRLDAVAKLIRDLDTGRDPCDTAHDFKMRVVDTRFLLLKLRMQ